ncbi:kinase-like protein [Trichodelitschia bisporula]|uniref:ethanolamine kinase n=1 Tax=Trichodelitschia bisporula TaxID=703511 RepID=A0A6G1HZD2_9PEZI|nr:kinase-like protein [Trichodelitschia bisporula]
MASEVKHIDLYYDNADSRKSALRLVLALRPEWEPSQDTIEFVRFTDGITNTLLKAENRFPGLSQHDIDQEAILLRAYGRGTDVLIDRNRECASHSSLAAHQLAPPLFARFNNGLLYKFIEGKVCSPEDLRRSEIFRGVAKRLAEWHAVMPVAVPSPLAKPVPNIWTVMQKWITALTEDTPAEKEQKALLNSELTWLTEKLSKATGIGNQLYIFAHCDLLSGNVIVLPPAVSEPASTSPHSSSASSPALSAISTEPATLPVSFIDYEYATPSPAAFDIANHFAEWGGFDCDFSVLPTRSQRREFLQAYLSSYNSFLNRKFDPADLDQLFAEVDAFRGAPGFYWGIWALIQAKISTIDFDYANYAQVRLGEYWAWKDALLREAGAEKGEIPLRERRWAQEE